ncbi:MAG: hypothetical protein ABJI41_14840 [Erythrobacter sp.]
MSYSSVAMAQDGQNGATPDFLAKLKECQAITDDADRLACFDGSVTAMVAANEAGQVQIVDQEDVRKTRRQLFGLSVPEIDILKGKDDDKQTKEARELLETTITSVRYLSSRKIRFTTQEDAVWEINRAPTRLRTVEAGDTVVFKKASLGTFFIRIDGQLGVKGKRVR